MRKIGLFLVTLITLITMSSCSQMVYSDDMVMVYGSHYVTNGVEYYVYRGVYYYPEYYGGVCRLRSFRSPIHLNHNNRVHTKHHIQQRHHTSRPSRPNGQVRKPNNTVRKPSVRPNGVRRNGSSPTRFNGGNRRR